ncbi:MAG: ATP-binding protein [Planctomycetota bacterium]
MSTKERHIKQPLDLALRQFRVVAVGGARQVGKSTLVETLPGRHFVTLDDLSVLAAARSDPQGFIDALPTPATIDEIQRVPELLLAIKARVDRSREPGAFLITGSSRLDTIQGIRESLAGRIALLELRPMTLFEGRGNASPVILEELDDARDATAAAALFARVRRPERVGGEQVLTGGFPEPCLHLKASEREAWLREYRRSYVERDAPAVVRVEDVPQLARFFLGATATTAQLLNLTNLARDTGVSPDTARRWIGLLEATFVAERRLPLWRNLRTRLVRSPKLYLCDSGLAASTLGLHDWNPAEHNPLRGHLLETWVHQQLAALAEVADPPFELSFFRTHGQEEVDFVLTRGRRAIAIEVKLGATVRPEDARPLERFAERLGKECRYGLVLYSGHTVIPLAPRTVAVPLSAFFAM